VLGGHGCCTREKMLKDMVVVEEQNCLEGVVAAREEKCFQGVVTAEDQKMVRWHNDC